jgi:hypothetical protein
MSAILMFGVGIALYFLASRIGWIPASNMSKSEKIADMMFHLSAWCFGVAFGLAFI